MFIDFFWKSKNAYVLGIEFNFLEIENKDDMANSIKLNKDFIDLENNVMWSRFSIKKDYWSIINDTQTLISIICSGDINKYCNYVIHFIGSSEYKMEWYDK